ncbi:CCAAT-binding transcription factor (CBF-B/NF-YA) subunit B-domain-containing protein [Lipomyces oligophaga]|uniref:CCAAT-binding transcription factor (CBF-B/NF-YA) subunit B-domain-containing protein n=1 Tax=Lipomyces oligophaga TaxID=45792 RepID=UPI0034CF52BB
MYAEQAQRHYASPPGALSYSSTANSPQLQNMLAHQQAAFHQQQQNQQNQQQQQQQQQRPAHLQHPSHMRHQSALHLDMGLPDDVVDDPDLDDPDVVHSHDPRDDSPMSSSSAAAAAAAAAAAGLYDSPTVSSLHGLPQQQQQQQPPPPSIDQPVDESDQPLYVNAKQYHRILKRRLARAKLEESLRVSKGRRPYLHESRHKHAMRRPRGQGGRFLTAAEVAELERKQREEAETVVSGSTDITRDGLTTHSPDQQRSLDPIDDGNFQTSEGLRAISHAHDDLTFESGSHAEIDDAGLTGAGEQDNHLPVPKRSTSVDLERADGRHEVDILGGISL